MPTTIKLTGLWILTLLASCSSAPEIETQEKPALPPTIINATITASERVNPDISGRASPIVVRIFELKGLGAFESADFYALHENPKVTLGADLVASEKLFLQPGESEIYKRTITIEPTYLAVSAAYRDLNQARWRASLPISAHQTNEVVISIDELSISMTLQEPTTPPVIETQPPE